MELRQDLRYHLNVLRGQDRQDVTWLKTRFANVSKDEWIQFLATLGHGQTAGRGAYDLLEPWREDEDDVVRHAEWCVQLLSWFVDELGLNLDDNPGDEYYRTIDYVLRFLRGPVRMRCFFFMWEHGFKSNCGWYYWICHEKSQRDEPGNEQIIKALLDRGVTVPPPPGWVDGHYPISQWQAARFRTRRQCCVFLACVAKNSSVIGSRDLGTLIAQAMWEMRWEDFETKESNVKK